MKKLILTTLTLLSVSAAAFACTGISIKDSSNNWIQARTIEEGTLDLNNSLIIAPAGRVYTTKLLDGKNGISWKQKYGFVGISTNTKDFICEGTNEKGLNAGIFFFKDYGSLERLTDENRSKALTDMDFVRWILGNFASVEEFIEGLKTISLTHIYKFPDNTHTPTGHWRVADKSGRNIVVEITNEGKINIHENTVGVVTNSPDYKWHETNLSNYINLKAGVSSSAKFSNFEAKSLSTGTAALGLPGDFSSPSRFVKAAFLLSNSKECTTTEEAVHQAFHVLNNFDIPMDKASLDAAEGDAKLIPSITQCTIASDLTNGRFYFKTMYNSAVRCVDIAQILKSHKTEVLKTIDEKAFIYEIME